MIDAQFQATEMPMMNGTAALDDDSQLFTERTAHVDPAPPGLNNLWLRRRAEYTALNRSGHTVPSMGAEYVEQ